MYKLILIGLGGFTGALLRYGVSGFVQNWSKNISFPYGTLVVNILGCFIIGLFSQLAETRGLFSPETRLFIFIGLLGSFTTYSSFGSETVNLMMDGKNLLSLTNIGLHLLLGLGAVWLGRITALFIWR
ncbi:MAG: fluoride efflux transporter CrcB [Chloroflexota bacterium]